MDAELKPQPQMVDRWEMSADRSPTTFTCAMARMARRRAGHQRGLHRLASSSGARAIRWRQALGFVSALRGRRRRTFRMAPQRSRTALMIDSLGKPGGSTPLMMPKRVAATDPVQADRGVHRLGPFIF